MKTVIVAGKRTPFGKFGGMLSSFTASDLGGMAIQGALEAARIAPQEIEEVIMGSVLQAGQGQIPSRQAAYKAGIPMNVPTETINKVCASGMRSVTLADQIIRSGDAQVIVAGGMESMSNAPYLAPTNRFGSRMGNAVLLDDVLTDGLTCAFHPEHIHMGVYGDASARSFSITRMEQDLWATRSQQLAVDAIEHRRFADELISIEKQDRKGNVTMLVQDEAPRNGTTVETLQRLKPAFNEDGTVTAGNAPGINDGAAALVLMSDEEAERRQLEPLATIIGHTTVAVEASRFPETPGIAIQKLLKKTNKSLEDIDLFEINEAFAVVALIAKDFAKIDQQKINVNGGAVALGHPIGASGTRIILTLAHQLKRQGGGIGIAAICSGGGQGDAIMIEV